MQISKNAELLLKKRYCLEGEEPLDVYKRVSQFLAQGDSEFEGRLFNAMGKGYFLPNSPCLFNAGQKVPSLHACFILPIHDDTTHIFKTVSDMARIFKFGGGVGINFSNLREKDAQLSGGGSSSGALSFMGIFDHVVETVKQGGKRRGALMGILSPSHPEIYDFITTKLKGKLQNFNLSIMVKDDFMSKVDDPEAIMDIISPKGYKVTELKVKDIFDVVCFTSWVNGDPAFLFYDRINRDNPLYPEVDIDTCNPCSEVAMPQYSACCLGSLNLSKFVRENDFNFDKFYDYCQVGMRTLQAMNDLAEYPIVEVKNAMDKYNPVGLGVMGFADCLVKLGIYYDSKECLDFIDKIGLIYKNATEDFAKDRFYFYKRIIAPTGSLSILADCSSGIEPIYDVAFERSLTVGKIEEVRDLYKSEYVRTAHQVSPEWHIKVLCQWQKWLDGGASKTVNLPNSASVEDVKNVYKLAWKLGAKGITVYRDGSRDQVLHSTTTNKFQAPKTKCEGEQCHL